MRGRAADSDTAPRTGATRDHGLGPLERYAWVLDSSIRLPGGYRIGLDGLIGLVPGVGDALGALLSSYIIGSALRMGVPRTVIARMTLNVALETVVGAIPIFGDLFDFMYKANRRNVVLLQEYSENPGGSHRDARKAVFLSAAFCTLVLVSIGFLAVYLVRWLFSLV